MRKIWLVIKREYLTRVRSRGFILSTVGLPLFAIGVFALSMSLMTRNPDRTLKISILDDLGGLRPQIAGGLSGKLPDGRPVYQIVGSWDQPQDEGKVREELNRQIRDGQLDGFLFVPKDALQTNSATFQTRSPEDFHTVGDVNHAVDNALVARRLGDRGIHIDDLREVLRGVDLSLVRVTQSGESEEKGQGFLVQISIGMILYITLLAYGMMTMRSVLEEKTTRIVEVLASSVRPSHLLSGKILGVAAVGFTQYLIWGVTAALVSAYGGAVGAALRPGTPFPALQLPAAFLVYPFVYFLAGYFLYASLYAALGAMASCEEDLQQVQLPVTIVLVACFILYPVIMRDPNSPLAVALTLFPLSAPILMVFRIMVQTPPFWQIALSLGLCVASTVGVVRFSAKIYRVGILMYGKRPSLGELLRWLRYT